MGYLILRSLGVAALIAVVLLTMAQVIQTSTSALQAAQVQGSAPVPQTPWGEPDLQGIWRVELLVPLEGSDEGNYGLPGLLVGSRAEEQRAFAEGRGPDPATKCIAQCSSPEGRDPLALR